MNFGLAGRTALVLGGGGGLGSAIAKTLGVEGAKVAVADIDAAAVNQTVKQLNNTGTQTLALVWDLADLKLVDQKISVIEQSLGPVNVLINITGGPPPTTAAGQDPALWSKHFHSMVLSVIAITDRVVPGMKTRGWGRVITSTSSGVVAPIPNLALSNALRLSLVGWSKTLAHEVARNGVTVNIVLPGRIATDRIRFLDEAKAKREGRSVEQVRAESTGAIPMGRYGNPEEYADTVAFLASMRASYITGSIIRIDGGLIGSI
jgi:3-oxoacyl-[acyl-carrier protein] reductase